MTESQTHKLIKNKIAETLQENGFSVQTEVITNVGRADVFAEKDGRSVKVEVYKSHIPDYLIAKVDGDIIVERKPKVAKIKHQVNLDQTSYDLLIEYARTLGPDASLSTAIKILLGKKK